MAGPSAFAKGRHCLSSGGPEPAPAKAGPDPWAGHDGVLSR